MNRHQLTEALAAANGLTYKQAAEFLASTFEIIMRQLCAGQTVTLTGFGTFRVSQRRARGGVDPRDPNKRIQIPAVKIPAFTAGKPFKETIRGADKQS